MGPYLSRHDYTLSDKELAIMALVSKQWRNICYNKIYHELFSHVTAQLKGNKDYIFKKTIGARIKEFKLADEQRGVLNRLVRSCIWEIEGKDTPFSQSQGTNIDIALIMRLIGQYAYNTNRDIADGNSSAVEGSPLSLDTSRYSRLTPKERIQETIDYVYKQYSIHQKR